MYFTIFTSMDDVKKRYRALSKLFHPDMGGPVELMQELNYYYDLKLKLINESETILAQENQEENDCNYEEYYDKIDKILRFSEFNKNFDPTFVKSVLQSMEKNDCINEGQAKSIDKIFTSFRVEERLKAHKP